MRTSSAVSTGVLPAFALRIGVLSFGVSEFHSLSHRRFCTYIIITDWTSNFPFYSRTLEMMGVNNAFGQYAMMGTAALGLGSIVLFAMGRLRNATWFNKYKFPSHVDQPLRETIKSHSRAALQRNLTIMLLTNGSIYYWSQIQAGYECDYWGNHRERLARKALLTGVSIEELIKIEAREKAEKEKAKQEAERQ